MGAKKQPSNPRIKLDWENHVMAKARQITGRGWQLQPYNIAVGRKTLALDVKENQIPLCHLLLPLIESPTHQMVIFVTRMFFSEAGQSLSLSGLFTPRGKRTVQEYIPSKHLTPYLFIAKQ